MVKDVTEAFLFKYDRETLTCDFPEVVADLVGTDSNFEIVSSSTLQTLRLFYGHNYAKRSVALIFVTTELKTNKVARPVVYYNAKTRGEYARQIFEQFLKFNEVKVCKNYSKYEII